MPAHKEHFNKVHFKFNTGVQRKSTKVSISQTLWDARRSWKRFGLQVFLNTGGRILHNKALTKQRMTLQLCDEDDDF